MLRPIIAFGWVIAAPRPTKWNRGSAQVVQSRNAVRTTTEVSARTTTTGYGTENDSSKRAHILIQSMTEFYVDMVDLRSHRFYSTCDPFTGERTHDPDNPIRDLAAAWDASKALLYHYQMEHNHGEKWLLPANEATILQRAMATTVEYYQPALTPLIAI
jgi:hypothetical protein